MLLITGTLVDYSKAFGYAAPTHILFLVVIIAIIVSSNHGLSTGLAISLNLYLYMATDALFRIIISFLFFYFSLSPLLSPLFSIASLTHRTMYIGIIHLARIFWLLDERGSCVTRLVSSLGKKKKKRGTCFSFHKAEAHACLCMYIYIYVHTYDELCLHPPWPVS